MPCPFRLPNVPWALASDGDGSGERQLVLLAGDLEHVGDVGVGELDRCVDRSAVVPDVVRRRRGADDNLARLERLRQTLSTAVAAADGGARHGEAGCDGVLGVGDDGVDLGVELGAELDLDVVRPGGGL